MIAGVLLIPSPPAVRLTVASACIALALIAATLLVSPVAVLQGRRAIASSDLRRDLGIWAGIVSLAHVGLGLWARFGQSAYIVDGRAAAFIVPAGGFMGVVATGIILVLLALSNDAAIRRLGLVRWKRLQRTARWLPILIGAHGGAWLLVRRAPVAVAMLAVLVLALTALRAVATAGDRLPTNLHVCKDRHDGSMSVAPRLSRSTHMASKPDRL